MQNIIYKKDRVVLCAEYGNPQLHRHFSKHILVSNKPFICIADGEQDKVNSMIIQSQIIHSIKKDTNAKLVVF